MLGPTPPPKDTQASLEYIRKELTWKLLELEQLRGFIIQVENEYHSRIVSEGVPAHADAEVKTA